ncbi:MAG TPA: hypothetical protein DEB74_11980 [Lachnospiraceae bacterium]|nr:hypothetical protein [Lachnospiraceae bacterium]
MKRIIGDKLYDTDKATLVAKDGGEFGEEFGEEFGGEFDEKVWDVLGIISSALYLKRTGEWFLCCEGELYDHRCERCRGPQIVPIAPHEAKIWLAENNFVDEYIQYFGEPEE